MQTKLIVKLYLNNGKKTFTMFIHDNILPKDEIVRRFLQQKMFKEMDETSSNRFSRLSKFEVHIPFHSINYFEIVEYTKET
jgi:hypothetical protein